ncbi:MAG: hypothetical protein BWY85_00469 [Firmicutes bacterium ADurb.Bin506]|nr:MAG: hypothetical protein BWY85_00469 [Firmicutes bacterium ADurb.Bin506]
MGTRPPTLEQWRALYDATVAFASMKPWDYINDESIIGVKDPVTGTVAYSSVMGGLGELMGLATYLGAEGLQHLHSAHADETDYDDIELGTNLRALMTTFESRRDLTKRDLDVIKKLGLTFKGPHDWPLFRSWEAGYAPWYLSQSEAVFLTHVLQQVTDVYLRARDNPSVLSLFGDDHYLIRVLSSGPDGPVWEDRLMRPEPPPQPAPATPVIVDELRLARLANTATRSDTVWEVDMFRSPTPIQEGRDERPYLPYMQVMVDSGSFTVLATECTSAGHHRQAFVDGLIKTMDRTKAIPGEIQVMRDSVLELCKPVASRLNVPVRRNARLPVLEVFVTSVMQRLGVK